MKDFQQNTLPAGYLLSSQKFNYRIEQVLGQGTFGITYLAKVELQGALGKLESNMLVAIKEFFMKEVNGRNEATVTSSSTSIGNLFTEYRTKFVQEAHNLSKLKHPHIVDVLEYFEVNNTCYYVMAYLPGGDLDHKIREKGYLPEEETLVYANQIADALIFMHENRMLHLDLKPKNIMLDAQGTTVLIDFGLSKQYDENGEPESSTSVGRGTPGYAPLEQANFQKSSGLPVTMDVYALGATIYKMLTGESPCDASMILNDGFPKKKLLEKSVSPWLIRVLEKAMAPVKKDRYQSVQCFKSALDNKSDIEESTLMSVGSIDKEETLVTKLSVKIAENKPLVEPSPKPHPKIRTVIAIIVIAILSCFVFMRKVLFPSNANSEYEGEELVSIIDYDDTVIGDYFYSDGTTSHVLDDQKICIGIVFSLDVSETEHVEGFTHGEIVALQDANDGRRCIWGSSNYDTEAPNYNNDNKEIVMRAKADLDGYSYDLAFAYGSEDASLAAHSYSAHDCPYISSWYLPTAGQWIRIIESLSDVKVSDDIFMQFNAVQVASNLKRVNIDPNKWYWANTEYNESHAWSVRINDGHISSATHKDANGAFVRAVAAF